MRIPLSARLENMRIFVMYCLERDTLLRSLRTALVVGTLLAFINHG